MDNYSNPFGAIDTNALAGNAGGPGFVNLHEVDVATEKAELAKPFIERAGQEQELELAKKRMEFGEQSSQEAKLMRAKEIMKKTAEYDADIARVNPTLARDLQKLTSETESLAQLSPFELAAKKAQAIEQARQLKGKPVSEFIGAAADFGNAFTKSKADPLTQASSYKDFVEGFKASHPDTVIPPNMETWSENLGKYLGLARLQSLYSTDFEQKAAMEREKLASEEKRTGMTAGATVKAAEVTAAQSDTNSERAYGSKEEQTAARREQQRDKLFQSLISADIEYMTADAPRKKQIREEYQAIADERYPEQAKKGGNIPAKSLEETVKASGYEFEPDKYDYRIGTNGIPQRKPKGK